MAALLLLIALLAAHDDASALTWTLASAAGRALWGTLMLRAGRLLARAF
jgi:hypothetical protein